MYALFVRATLGEVAMTRRLPTQQKKEKRDSALYHFKHGSGYYCKELRLKRCRYVLYIVNIIWYRSPRWSCGYPRMLLLLIAMIAEFDFLYGDIVNEFCKNNK